MASTRKVPFYQTVDGFIIPGAFSADAFRETLKYKPIPEDIFVTTFPKCGTTWTQFILMLILNKGKGLKNKGEFMSHTPFLEMCGPEVLEIMPRPGAIKTHLPFNIMPYSPEAKYFIIARNPKDTCVSFYHHTKGMPLYEFTDGSFEDFFEIFINGENDFGDYFDFLLSWYEHRNDPNVFFTTYEEMKEDTRAIIVKFAKFLGDEYEEMLLKDPEILENVLHYSSIGEMKKLLSSLDNMSELTESPMKLPAGLLHVIKNMEASKSPTDSSFQFVRKGIVGDWKTLFSDDQSKRLDKKCKEKLGDTAIYDYWKKLGILK